MAKLPLATFEKVLKATGNVRVSDRATLAFTEAIAEIAEAIARDAAQLALHANRKTIMEQDVKLAYKKRT
ncbi:MAG: NFYB/HAP3 family transcription factor subunit [Nanoarchaeota archaeon]|nr:NFYB/HAP3 family transcription factor subunit [Nanoarchaeota archaeon]